MGTGCPPLHKKKKKKKEIKRIHPRCSQIKFQTREDNSRRKKELGSHPVYSFYTSIHFIHFISPTTIFFPPHHTHAPLDQCDL
jgi:hypothetical protein